MSLDRPKIGALRKVHFKCKVPWFTWFAPILEPKSKQLKSPAQPMVLAKEKKKQCFDMGRSTIITDREGGALE